ncbi:Pentatricopeptide repeat [Melia azedarach]|uniref:Pentatricopeptide repeat n=1 Tax=Melia azedarach TaxID=155640 RepID=A0ACC1Y5U4_MELAZ|nr:Pentatricopeptide repeat [Melia azedarach]
MLWRCERNLLYITRRRQILKTIPFKSIHYISSPQVCSKTTQEPLKLFSRESFDDPHQDFPNKSKPIILCPHIVYSALLNCPSDLIALSFFIWCAKQRDYFHNAQSFDYMTSVVTRLTGRCKTVRGIVSELERVGCVTKAQTFLLLLRIYWRGGMNEMVFETFEELGHFGYTPNTFARNIVMDVLFKIGRADIGIKVLKENQSPNFLSFNIALCNLCKLNDMVNVKHVIRIMLRKGFYPNVETFEMVLNCFCKMGRITEAYQVLGLIITLGISLSVNAWSVLIDGFCRFRRLDMAVYFLEKMVETGCSPNVVTYTSLIKGFMEAKMVSSAFSILDIVESNGHAPDLVFYNVLIDCLSKIGRYEDALDVFAGLSKQKLVPDSYTFCSLLSTLSLSRRFSLLPKLVCGLQVEADLVVYNALLSYFCKAGFSNQALELYDSMLDRGFTPDNYSFVGLLSGLCGARRIDEAVNVYQGIIMSYPTIDAYVHTVIIDRLVRVGKCHSAVKLFRRAILEKYPLDVVSYTVAIHGFLKGRRIAEASTLYSQMKDVGLSPNSFTYNIMLSGFCKEKDIKMVEQLLQEIIEARVELNYNTFVRVTKFIFKFHPSSLALNQLSEMWNLGLIPEEAMHVPLFDEFVSCVRVDEQNYSLLKGDVEDNQLLNSSSSDDFSDVAASIG